MNLDRLEDPNHSATMVTGILLCLFALAIGLGGSLLLGRYQRQQQVAAVKEEAEGIQRRAEAEQEAARRRAEATAREEALSLRQRLAAERQDDEDTLAEREAALAVARESLAEEIEQRDQRESVLEEREDEGNHALERARSIRAEAKALRAKAEQQVEEAAGQSREECCTAMATAMTEAALAEAADQLRHLETEPGAGAIREAKRVMGISIGRIAHRHQAIRQSYNVEVSSKQRERLEDPALGILDLLGELAGVRFNWINDGAAIRIETGDGVGRVTARRALEKILSLSNPTPDQIRDVATACQADMQGEITGFGRKAFKGLGLKLAHPEVVDLVGRLYFRTSYTQNQWEHVREAAYLAGLMAAELGLDVTLARRASLLHDIGKALTHEVEGSHALIGAEIARRCGEPEAVVAGIEEHHGEKPTTSVYSLLVAAADSISGARPGARRELVETYGERIQELERLACSFHGVTTAHAVQAGREVRVLVDEKQVDDTKAAAMATDIAGSISEKLTFPGQIRVTVIREFSAIEFAN